MKSLEKLISRISNRNFFPLIISVYYPPKTLTTGSINYKIYFLTIIIKRKYYKTKTYLKKSLNGSK